ERLRAVLEPPDWTLSDREETRRQLTEEFGNDFMRPFGWAQPQKLAACGASVARERHPYRHPRVTNQRFRAVSM
ncbi:MAG: hypothetical protein WEB67_05365, partial [Acidimicrobiia bacterium]